MRVITATVLGIFLCTLFYGCAENLHSVNGDASHEEAGGYLNGYDVEGDENMENALELCDTAQEFWQRGEFDESLELLDRAYSLMLDVDSASQQKDDLRFLISKRIMDIYSSRTMVVTGNGKAIPIIVNKYVQAEIDLFNGRERQFFINSYKRSGMYRPMILKALKKAGLPRELSWLPLIESGYKPIALSRARALGLWQFISSTGYKFGLKRDLYIDERLDPLKSTHAAIKYLHELHTIFGDWTTALAAYNCGEGRVLNLIMSQNVKHRDNFWDLYQKLPSETSRYVPKFLATLHMVNNPEKYGLHKVKVDRPPSYDRIEVGRQVHLKDAAKALNVSLKYLKALNPELRYDILPPAIYPLKVPKGQGRTLLAKLDRLPVSSVNVKRKSVVYHRIRKGESLYTIARRYRTSVGRIARANKIKRYNKISAGKRLRIPVRGSVSYAKKSISRKYSKKIKRGGLVKHVVQRGDSLWFLARHYNTTAQKIRRVNGLSGTMLHVGQVLRIPR